MLEVGGVTDELGLDRFPVGIRGDEAGLEGDLLQGRLQLRPLQHLGQASRADRQLDHLVGHVGGVTHSRVHLGGGRLL